LIVFNLFAETVGGAPNAIVANPGYVKKVVFPLEILPVVNLGVAVVNASIGVVILLAGIALFEHRFPLGLVYLPFTLLPLLMLSLGMGWFVASVAVYVRDTAPIVTVLLQMLFFLTPLFYPISQVPPAFQVVMRVNPLSTIVEGGRRNLMYDLPPDWAWLALVTAASALVMLLGFAWFMKTKPGFADVL
jgi:lipopolysaccharide transport system permease protein